MITGYSVQYRIRGTSSYSTRSVSGSGTTTYTITNLNLDTVYEVRVASVGPLGVSGYCCGSGKQVKTYDCECRLSKDSFCSDISLNYTCRDCHASASNRTHSLLKLLMLHIESACSCMHETDMQTWCCYKQHFFMWATQCLAFTVCDCRLSDLDIRSLSV